MKILFFLIGVFLNGLSSAQLFEPPVIIDPPNPTAGDNIRVGLFTTFYPPCLILPQENLDGETHLFDFNNSLPAFPENHIDLIVVALDTPICMPFPVSPAPREYYDLGQLAAGDYSLRTGLVGPVSQFPLPPNENPIQYGEVITFSVSGSQVPVSVNATSNISLAFILVLVLLLTYIQSNKDSLKFRR